jgi:hypothetical protein
MKLDLPTEKELSAKFAPLIVLIVTSGKLEVGEEEM